MNLAFCLTFFICISFFLFVMHRIFIKQIKAKSEQHLAALQGEIQRETKQSEKHSKAINEFQKTVQENQSKFDDIKLEIFQIDFSLKEICKFIPL